MREAISVIKQIAELTDRAILFHSATGKDSIALLDLMAPHFRQIACVFMYLVPDLEHNNAYIRWAMNKYPNITFTQIPHYAVYSYIRVGLLGCRRNPKQKQYKLEALTNIIRERTGIEWAFFGFKQTDSLNRRLMLRTYCDEAISFKTSKVYPLSKYKNADVLRYIERHNLIRPERFDNRQSASEDLQDINYLLHLRTHYPNDLKKIYAVFPLAERLLFEYDNKGSTDDGTE